jgi:predicted membrane chloride channel (bestrophin family)
MNATDTEQAIENIDASKEGTEQQTANKKGNRDRNKKPRKSRTRESINADVSSLSPGVFNDISQSDPLSPIAEKKSSHGEESQRRRSSRESRERNRREQSSNRENVKPLEAYTKPSKLEPETIDESEWEEEDEKPQMTVPPKTFWTQQEELTWEQLEEIEKRRRAVLLRGEYGVWKALRCFDGTVMMFLSRDSLFWLTLVLFLMVRLQARLSSLPNFVSGLGDSNVTTIGGFITFFLALYVNNSHSRYFEQYDFAMNAKGRILDVATLGVTYLPKATAVRIVRYMNAANVSAFVGLSDIYSYDNFFVKLNKEFGLLTSKELKRMKHIDLDKGGSCNRELIVWALREIKQCHDEGILDNELAREFRDHILRFRGALGAIYDAADLPIPFFYVHFISLLTALYLPLYSISAAYQVGGPEASWLADVVVGLIVVLQAIFVNGLRLLGQKMNDPFGDDLTDLSVRFYVTFTWTMSNRILESPYAETFEKEEARLQKSRISLGDPWQPKKEIV